MVCRQLGYPRGAMKHTRNSFFGEVNSKMAMENVHCNGEEEHIQDCDYSTYDSCGSSEGAGVVCLSKIILPLVSLSGINIFILSS